MGDLAKIGLSFRANQVLVALPSDRWVDRRTLDDFHGFSTIRYLNELFDAKRVTRSPLGWKRL